MKSQLMPTKPLEVGQILYKAASDTDEDTGKTSVEIQSWVVRSYRRKRGTMTSYGVNLHKGLKKLPLSTNRRYYNLSRDIPGLTRTPKGWLDTPDWCDLQFSGSNERLPRGLYTTKLKAVEYEIYTIQSRLDRYMKTKPTPEEEDLYHLKSQLKALKTRVTRIKNKKKKDKITK